MHALYRTALVDDLSTHWCNADALATGMLEAMSLITPALEQFQIRTVLEALGRHADAALCERVQHFIDEESTHARTHVKFNAALAPHLRGLPPGLAIVRALLRMTRQHGSLRQRLLLVAAIEHVSAVMSAAYLAREPGLRFTSPFARELFAQHAQEEIGHRSVAFDLWAQTGRAGAIERSLTLLAILGFGGVYALFAVPWIVRRKTGRRQLQMLLQCYGRLLAQPGWLADQVAAMRALFSFVRRDFHPDSPADFTIVER